MAPLVGRLQVGGLGANPGLIVKTLEQGAGDPRHIGDGREFAALISDR